MTFNKIIIKIIILKNADTVNGSIFHNNILFQMEIKKNAFGNNVQNLRMDDCLRIFLREKVNK